MVQNLDQTETNLAQHPGARTGSNVFGPVRLLSRSGPRRHNGRLYVRPDQTELDRRANMSKVWTKDRAEIERSYFDLYCFLIEELLKEPGFDPETCCYEPANYKAALSDPEFEKWLVAMNAEMQSMYDNKVWRLVVLSPNAKVVKSKWIYMKKTDIDVKVHIYKARLVTKGCTQTYGVDYEETFSPVADIRAVRILIAIAAYYDYEIWQMDDKIASLNGFLEDEIYMEQPKEMKRMQNVPYASAVESIMYAVRCTRPDVAFAQNITSRFQSNSGEAHWTTVKNIFKYLRNTKDTFLVYGGDPEAELRVNCYCDARFETDRDDTKSQTGYVFILNGGAVVWKSSKQSITAHHAT
nr:retrovirus-related Pol polyprotein from transposon TNT 1-94 [Tanacetum cinerariifolium]